MNWRETLRAAWENRGQIADGFYHTYLVHKPEIDAEADRRKSICESNVCGRYDPIGKPETSMIPGKPACSSCHCNIEAKVHCTYCYCALRDEKLPELWSEMLTKEQDDLINAKAYKDQFKPKQ